MLNRRLSRTLSAPAIALATLAGTTIPATDAPAQMVFVSEEGSGAGGSMNPPVTSRELKRYGDLLGLSAEQREVADEMWGAFEAEFQNAAREMRDAMDELRAEAEDTGDFQVLIEGLGPVQQKLHSTTERLRDAFMEDLQLILDEQQQAMWPTVERTRRRERGMQGGQFSGETVDLVALVRDLELSDAAQDQVQPLLDQYELDLDKAIIDRTAASEEQAKWFAEQHQGESGGFMGLTMNSDDPEFQRIADRKKDASKRVRDINRRYARQITSTLEGDDALAFDSVFQSESFPQIYRSTYVDRVMDAASQFGDLTQEQRDTLDSIMDSYGREVGSVNDRWASATEEMEENSTGLALSMGGMNRSIRISDSEGDEDPVDDARRARRELDRRTLDRVRSLLTEDQLARLPERRRERPQSFTTGGGDMVFVERVEVVVDDDGNTTGEDHDVNIGGRQ